MGSEPKLNYRQKVVFGDTREWMIRYKILDGRESREIGR